MAANAAHEAVYVALYTGSCAALGASVRNKGCLVHRIDNLSANLTANDRGRVCMVPSAGGGWLGGGEDSYLKIRDQLASRGGRIISNDIWDNKKVIWDESECHLLALRQTILSSSAPFTDDSGTSPRPHGGSMAAA